MHIGISRPPAPAYPVPDVDGALLAEHAERLGFESIFYGEHPSRPLGESGVGPHPDGPPLFQDTLVTLARASAMTTTLKVGGGVFLAPLHHPVLFAKQLATLDFYSGGRLLVGIGVGWSRIETEMMGGNFDRRWAQTLETLDLMTELWTKERVEWKGEFFTVPPVQCFPQPASRPRPPILLGAHGPSAFARIVRHADGWLPAFVTPEAIEAGPDAVRAGRRRLDELASAAGRDPSSLQITAIVRGTASREVLRRFEDASLDRAIISLPFVATVEEGRAALDRLADDFLG